MPVAQESWTIGQMLRRQATLLGDNICLEILGSGVWTYRELWRETSQFAAGLSRLGIKPGETVVIMAGNSFCAIQAWLGVNCAGATEVTINPAYRGALLAHAIRSAEATAIVLEDRFLPMLKEVEHDLPRLELAIVIGDAGKAEFTRIKPRAYSDIPVDVPSDWEPEGRYNDIASIIYTSGTSGPAKGVMLTHAQNHLTALTAVEGLRLHSADTYYCAHPLFHMAGKFLTAQAIFLAGGRLHLDSGFFADEWIQRIDRARATVTVAHGPMLEMIYARPRSPADAETRLTRVLACPLPKGIAEGFEARFQVKAIEGYGMTEIGVPCWRPYDDALRLGSCGKVLDAYFDVRIADPESDEPLPAGQTGQILVRPKMPWTLMQGYRGMPERTVESWRNMWFQTGDAGYRDDEGYFFFVDRLKDRIRRRSETISSYDIEVAVSAYAGIVDCAAVGVASEFENDDDIKVCVVYESIEPFDHEGLLKHIAGRLPHFMVPRYVELLDALPRTPTNKIMRAALRGAGVSGKTWDRKEVGISVRSLRA